MSKLRPLALGLVTLAGIGGQSCASSAGDPPAEPCPADTAAVQRDILSPRCGIVGCHVGEDAVQGLDLVSPGLVARVAGVVGQCDRPIVTPGHPENSYLFSKVSLRKLSCGGPMPLDHPALPTHEVECLSQWIAALPLDGGAVHGGEAEGGSGGTWGSTPDGGNTGAGAAKDGGAVHGPLCPSGKMACAGRCVTAVEPTFTSIYSSVVAHTCVFSSCHGGTAPKEDLDMSTIDAAYGHLVGVSAKQVPDLHLVESGDPAKSYLVDKVLGVDLPAMNSTGDGPSERMPQPPNRPLCPEKIAVIEQWITAGAKR